MKGLNDAYVESIIEKSKDGKLPPGRRRQSSTKQYVNRLKKAYAEKGQTFAQNIAVRGGLSALTQINLTAAGFVKTTTNQNPHLLESDDGVLHRGLPYA